MSKPEYNRLSNTLNFNFLIEVFVNFPFSNQGKPYPEAPIVFIKLPSTISGKHNFSYSLFTCFDQNHSFRNLKTLASTYNFLIPLFLQLERYKNTSGGKYIRIRKLEFEECSKFLLLI